MQVNPLMTHAELEYSFACAQTVPAGVQHAAPKRPPNIRGQPAVAVESAHPVRLGCRVIAQSEPGVPRGHAGRVT